MIPYFQINILVLGPITIQVWGLFVALGILAGTFLSYQLTKKVFLSTEVTLDLVIWSIVGGIIGARLFHVVLYEPGYYLANPAEILFLWQGGASSFGGFMGALAAVLIFSKKRKFTWKELLPYFDILSLGLWLGWAIGRIGCFMIHDHPGRLSRFFLAVNFPEGARFDLGLLESFLTLVIFLLFIIIWKKLLQKGWGRVFLGSFLIYVLGRFGLDFLRATDLRFSDPRFFYLTPMQWGIIVVLIGLTVVKIYSKISAHKS